MTTDLPPRPHVCEDCGVPVPEELRQWVAWPPPRSEGPYLMCVICTEHSIKNRRAQRVNEDGSPYEGPTTQGT